MTASTPLLFEPARFGDGSGGRKDQRASRLDARKQRSGWQAEIEAATRPRVFSHRALRPIEGRADQRGGNGGRIDAASA